MKHSFLIFTVLIFNNYFAQNDLELKIINDTIKKVSMFDDNSIFYSLKNNSDKMYQIILDGDEFNEHGEYSVEPEFVGLPEYYVFEKSNLLNPDGVSDSEGNKFNIDRNSDDFRKFKRKFNKIFNKNDIEVAFGINSRILKLKPEEVKYFSTRVDFPRYRRRYIDLKNKSEYYFQISLQIPKEIVDKYYLPTRHKNDTETVFVGQIFSQKIPLIYEVYNYK